MEETYKPHLERNVLLDNIPRGTTDGMLITVLGCLILRSPDICDGFIRIASSGVLGESEHNQ